MNKKMTGLILTVFCLIPFSTFGEEIKNYSEIKSVVWQYIDGNETKRKEILEKLKTFKEPIAVFEKAIREGKEYKKDVAVERSIVPVKCEHVDYETSYFLYVPTSYDPSKSYSLVIVFEGGNWSMGFKKAVTTALEYFDVWMKTAKKEELIVASPVTQRGWGRIGMSISFSVIADVMKKYNVDPDRVYAWGQSMGGHAAWRAGLYTPCRWAGIAPICGGYDYKDALKVLNNIPLYHVWGDADPHTAGLTQINRNNAELLEELKYDVKSVERKGGHVLFQDEIPKIVEFFSERPRNLYPKKVIAAAGYPFFTEADPGNQDSGEGVSWTKEDHKWTIPLPIGRFYWTQMLEKKEKDEDPEKPKEGKLTAEIKEGNKIEVQTENVKKYAFYLHDKLVDMDKPIEIYTNGKLSFSGKVERSLETMLEEVTAYHDRGRIFYAKLIIDVKD